MVSKPWHIRDAMKSSVGSFGISLCVIIVSVYGQEGNGCGHTVLGEESGTLASPHYPGTYPADSWCRWRVRVAPGRTLRLLFGDFDVEESPGCRNGSLSVMAADGATSIGPLCGKLGPSGRNVTVNSDEVTIVFRSGPHRSGRGFLLSYTTDQHPDLISCLQRGSHFITQQFSVFCPAGCKNVTGDICGHSEQGYRDTSVLCKAAVHAGTVSDRQGGQVSVTRGRSLTLYESSFANGILSKMGSLSEKKLLFSQECKDELTVSGVNASSFWEEVDSLGQRVLWSPGNTDSAGKVLPWAADSQDTQPSLELELSDRSTVTGIITDGTPELHIESYSLVYSRDGKSWKAYRAELSRERRVFQAQSSGHLRVLNSLFPPVVARYVRLQPQRWRGRASAGVQLLGCPVLRPIHRDRSAGGATPVKVAVSTTSVPASPVPRPVPTHASVVVTDSGLSSGQPMIVAVGVVLGLVLCVSCLLAGVWWKRRRKAAHMKTFSLPQDCQISQGKSLPRPEPVLPSYPLERSVHDALPNPPPLNDYAEVELSSVVGPKLVSSSTFRPAVVDEGYTLPFLLNHYHTPPGPAPPPEYAEPLPSEPEYATPFGDPPSATPPPGGAPRATPMAVYDCPAHRQLTNGYCTPSLHAGAPRPSSALYAEPQCSDVSLQHTYHEPL